MLNCTFAYNQAQEGGAVFYYDDRGVNIANCLLWGNTAPSGPQIHPLAPSAQIQPASPALNAGRNALLPFDIADLNNNGDTTELLPFDLEGNVRISGGTVDLGAYELPFALDVSSQVQVIIGGFRRNLTTGRYTQTVILKNLTTSAIQGPLSLALDSLSSNARLYNKTGTTHSRSPYLNTGTLAAGKSVMLTLEFANPTHAAITYTTHLLAGTGVR